MKMRKRRIYPNVLTRHAVSFGIGCLMCGCGQGQDQGQGQGIAENQTRSLGDALTTQENTTQADTTEENDEPDQPMPEEVFVHPQEIAKEAFGEPPDSKRLSKENLWADRSRQRVYFDGYVTMREGPLEMLACPVGSKEHESVIATLPRSQEVHAALLFVGAKPGTPVAFIPNFVPATGQRIRVWVCYRDDQGKFHAIDARRWIRQEGTDDHLDEDWVFGGSGFWKDPRDNHEYYRADGGDMICVSNFATAMMDVPIASSAEASGLMYVPYTERIPERGLPVRVVLVPIPLPKDKPDDSSIIDPDKPPSEDVLPVN